ncbi:hypothetical protein R6Q59_004967 [Mikania micrantha]
MYTPITCQAGTSVVEPTAAGASEPPAATDLQCSSERERVPDQVVDGVEQRRSTGAVVGGGDRLGCVGRRRSTGAGVGGGDRGLGGSCERESGREGEELGQK